MMELFKTLVVLGLFLWLLVWCVRSGRRKAAKELVRHADIEHQWVLRGDPRGVYGQFSPAEPD